MDTTQSARNLTRESLLRICAWRIVNASLDARCDGGRIIHWRSLRSFSYNIISLMKQTRYHVL